MASVYLAVPCFYCGAKRGQECRNTMLPYRPPTDAHRIRIDYWEGTTHDQ